MRAYVAWTITSIVIALEMSIIALTADHLCKIGLDVGWSTFFIGFEAIIVVGADLVVVLASPLLQTVRVLDNSIAERDFRVRNAHAFATVGKCDFRIGILLIDVLYKSSTLYSLRNSSS